ncbi:hypothetical protein [Hymenobacter negativus]|uniref:Uncharacterized protein n=1 Tax=Hymenobacter negativus TaxID=2795026 RepID=A0ABS3QB64_9BACT|nr:hypothetical protein [Hymenobacter negativus]MBO2008488.1 hypothetical protein [Hymenobacter negativus]
MTYIPEASVSQKAVYKRPYKTRQQRRLADRKKYDESKDRKFLMWMAGAVAILLLIAIGFMAQGVAERSAVEAASLPTGQ